MRDWSNQSDDEVQPEKAEGGRSLRHTAMDLLARREHARRELFDKLCRRFPPEQVTAELDRLADEGLQSDQRFVDGFIRGRATRGYGPQRIALELRQRGVAASLISEQLAVAEIDWLQHLRELSQRRFGDDAPEDARERGRRWRFLQQRGFGSDWIRALDEK